MDIWDWHTRLRKEKWGEGHEKLDLDNIKLGSLRDGVYKKEMNTLKQGVLYHISSQIY